MPTAFFCHASEDKPVVEAVYERVLSYSPDLSAWLDKFEILGGESLIERIAAGMDESDKFVIFLSKSSIPKPWVKRELRRAIMREINGVDPDFIIPVLIGDVSGVPAFLEDKKYIDLFQQSENEWLAELVAAIRGERPSLQPESTAENLEVLIRSAAEKPNVAEVIFSTRFWAADLAFWVRTTEDIQGAQVEPVTDEPAYGFGFPSGKSEFREPRRFGIKAPSPQISPGRPMKITLTFADGVRGDQAIAGIDHFV